MLALFSRAFAGSSRIVGVGDAVTAATVKRIREVGSFMIGVIGTRV
jgi:hypothetical protein